MPFGTMRIAKTLWHIQKMTDKTNLTDRDDLGLFCALIERVTVTFNPTRSIKIEIIRPVNSTEKTFRYEQGTLTFKNVIQSDLELKNERYEYPEFYRSAVLETSDLLTKNIETKGAKKGDYHDYYLYIDHGNSQGEYHIICETHELTMDNNPRLLSDFEGFQD